MTVLNNLILCKQITEIYITQKIEYALCPFHGNTEVLKNFMFTFYQNIFRLSMVYIRTFLPGNFVTQDNRFFACCLLRRAVYLKICHSYFKRNIQAHQNFGSIRNAALILSGRLARQPAA
jgi:hypothetical protein